MAAAVERRSQMLASISGLHRPLWLQTSTLFKVALQGFPIHPDLFAQTDFHSLFTFRSHFAAIHRD
jgi:hypothetical protein